MKSKETIDWFWVEFDRLNRFTSGGRICQCDTENFICESSDPTRMRSFLLVAVTIDQTMRRFGRPPGYQKFREMFRFPELYLCQTGDEGNPGWFLRTPHSVDKKMVWEHLGPMTALLFGDLCNWLTNQEGRETAEKFLQRVTQYIDTRLGGEGKGQFLEAIGNLNRSW